MQIAVSQAVKSKVAWAGWRIPCPIAGAPVILLYHGTPRKTVAGRVDETAFAEHVRFLKNNFELIAPDDFGGQRNDGRARVLLTFDDGFRNNYEVARPILRHYRVPAMFFVCSRPAVPGKHLWFAYLHALEDYYPEAAIGFRGQTFSMQSTERRSSMERLKNVLLNLRPHAQAMYEAIENELPKLSDFMTEEQIGDLCEGMSPPQIRALAADPLFTVGCHTVDHPFLSRCTPEERKRQISDNKRWIEQVIDGPSDTIAYPSGDYDSRIVEECKQNGFSRGYAVIPSERASKFFELGRIGIYRPSLDILGCVVRWGNVMRTFGVAMG